MKSNFHGNPPPRILIVEDGLIMARDIERRLQSLGYVVAGLAQSGDEAVHAVTNLKPDLILMDVNLRGPLDGIQAAAKIHAMVDVPVVYVTAYSDEATLTRARETEPFDYVLKPFDEKELRTTIEMSLYRHELYRRMRESEQRYRMVADQSTLFSYAFRVPTDGTLRLEWVTDGFGRMTGLPSDTIAHLEDHVHPEDAVMRIRCKAMAAGKEVVPE
jgi:CheY-like chemotaxis protein